MGSAQPTKQATRSRSRTQVSSRKDAAYQGAAADESREAETQTKKIVSRDSPLSANRYADIRGSKRKMPTAYAASAPPRLTLLDAAMGFLGNGGFARAARISTKARAAHQPASVTAFITKP